MSGSPVRQMANVGQLYAPKQMAGIVPTIEEEAAMARDLGADSLAYLPLDAVARCIGLSPERLCRACLTRDYPTDAGEENFRISLTLKDDGKSRVYAARACRTVET
jgi:amidophosphoribosyltransferase